MACKITHNLIARHFGVHTLRIMNICSIQPPYAYKSEDRGKSIAFIISQLDACDGSCDLILTPEFSNVPGTKPDSVTLAEIIKTDTEGLVAAA